VYHQSRDGRSWSKGYSSWLYRNWEVMLKWSAVRLSSLILFCISLKYMINFRTTNHEGLL
jgi:hypothetical protein